MKNKIQEMVEKYTELLHHEDPAVRQLSEMFTEDLNSISVKHAEISEAAKVFDGMGHGVEAFIEGAECVCERLGIEVIH